MDTKASIQDPEAPDRHRFADFRTAFLGLPVIPLLEIGMRFPEMHRSRLSQWQQRGLLLKVRNGFYRIAERPITDHERWAIANAIHAPSYVSLRTALAHYGFIPEGVFHVESITTSTTRSYAFSGTDYSFRHVRPSFYFGYRFVELNGARAMLASPEKALLDLLYLEPEADGPDGFEAWRLNADEILATIDLARMDDLAQVAGSKALLTRYRRLKNWMHDHAG